MKGPALVFLSLALAAPAAIATEMASQARGDAAAGKAKAAVCSACHGADGNSINPAWPSLAGQHAIYIVQQLAAFRSGDRVNALMSGQAMALSDADMLDLAAYYSSLEVEGGEADPALFDRAQKLYLGGNSATSLPACGACHGPAGQGNPLSAVPAIAGQQTAYLVATLKAYRSGERQSIGNPMMNEVAAVLADDEITALASYIRGMN